MISQYDNLKFSVKWLRQKRILLKKRGSLELIFYSPIHHHTRTLSFVSQKRLSQHFLNKWMPKRVQWQITHFSHQPQSRQNFTNAKCHHATLGYHSDTDYSVKPRLALCKARGFSSASLFYLCPSGWAKIFTRHFAPDR